MLALFYSLCLRLSFINNVLLQTGRGWYGMTLIEWLMMVLGGLTGNSEWFSDVGADFGKNKTSTGMSMVTAGVSHPGVLSKS